MGIIAAASVVLASAVGLTIWGVNRNKNQERIAQKNLEIIHKKFDDLYGDNKDASEKAKKIFDSVKSSINDHTKWPYYSSMSKVAKENISDFVDILNGKIALNEKNKDVDVKIKKPHFKEDAFIFEVHDEWCGNGFGYDCNKKCFFSRYFHRIKF